jgi:ABC-type phosphate transport system substrate-binding protein
MRRRPLLVAALLAPLWLAATSFAQAPAPYELIVNPSNGETALDRKFVEDAFLKKVTRWSNDAAIHPVDLPPSSPVRRAFSEQVLHRSVDAVKGYWQQRIFSGRDVPPPELGNDEEAIDYVLKHEGAIGYVAGSANLRGCRIASVR